MNLIELIKKPILMISSNTLINLKKLPGKKSRYIKHTFVTFKKITSLTSCKRK